jgi:hypothetical protein
MKPKLTFVQGGVCKQEVKLHAPAGLVWEKLLRLKGWIGLRAGLNMVMRKLPVCARN